MKSIQDLVAECPAPVLIFSTQLCGFCRAAKAVFTKMDIDFQDIAVDGDRTMRQVLLQETGSRTVPQIWLAGQYIGGYTEMNELARSGQLQTLLQGRRDPR